MRKRKIVNFKEVCEEINRHFLWELTPFFPKIGLSDLKNNGSKWCNLVICPFHEEKTASFRYSADSGFFHCYGCGKSGNLITFYEKLSWKTFLESVIRLAKFLRIRLIWENKRSCPGIKEDIQRTCDRECEVYILWERVLEGEENREVSKEDNADEIPF
jgi:DNA primase